MFLIVFLFDRARIHHRDESRNQRKWTGNLYTGGFADTADKYRAGHQ